MDLYSTWSLVDRIGPTRLMLVTCTFEVPQWSASSLRHSPPDCTAELVLRTKPSRLGAQREGTTLETSTTRRPRPSEGSSLNRTSVNHMSTTSDEQARNRKGSDHQKADETSHHHEKTRPHVSCGLISLPSSALLLPVYRSALLRALAGMFPKGGVPPFQRFAPPSLSLRPPSSSCGNVPEGGVP